MTEPWEVDPQFTTERLERVEGGSELWCPADECSRPHGALCPLVGCEEYGCHAVRAKGAPTVADPEGAL